jgi:hypothetical protein
MPFDVTGGAFFPAVQMRRVLFLRFRPPPFDDPLYCGSGGFSFYPLKFGRIKSKNEPVIFPWFYSWTCP